MPLSFLFSFTPFCCHFFICEWMGASTKGQVTFALLFFLREIKVSRLSFFPSSSPFVQLCLGENWLLTPVCGNFFFKWWLDLNGHSELNWIELSADQCTWPNGMCTSSSCWHSCSSSSWFFPLTSFRGVIHRLFPPFTWIISTTTTWERLNDEQEEERFQ